jgi:hypothetical protein
MRRVGRGRERVFRSVRDEGSSKWGGMLKGASRRVGEGRYDEQELRHRC